MEHCDNCGAPLRPNVKFCSQCGQAVAVQPASGSGAPPPTPDPADAALNLPRAAAPSPDQDQTAQAPAPSAAQSAPAAPLVPPVPPMPGISAVPPPAAIPTSSAPATQRLDDMLHERYLVVRKLGEGGMGAVYLAEDTVLYGRQCVIKEMLPYYTNEREKQEAEKFFLREVRLLANLKHPGIPQVFDHFIIDDRYYYVMEYVEGETLGARAARLGGRLPESEGLDYMRQIADVLVYISGRPEPVIHRDIKPENLILDQTTNQVKLVDFGLAKASMGAQVLGEQSSALGTPGYAPLEQYQGKSEPRSDIYALGATMHHLLTGVDPRQAPAPFQFAAARSLVPGISVQTEALLTRMLDLNLANRPTAEQLKSSLTTGSLPQTAASPPQGVVYTAGMPINFRSGALARDVDELAQICERFWDDGVYHLYQGHLEAWLTAQGRADLAQTSESIRGRMSDRNAGLEEFLHVLNPALAFPVLKVEPDLLDYGKIEKGTYHTLAIQVTNSGRGYLYGAVRALVPWIKVRSTRVGCRAGGKQEINIDIETSDLRAGEVQDSILELQTNGGGASIAGRAEVTWEPKLKLSATRLSLGDVHVQNQGEQLTGTLTLQNAGGGVLQGEISSDEPWLEIQATGPFHLDSGQSLVLQIVADTAAIPALSSVEGAVTIQVGSELVAVPVRMGVKKEIYDPLPRALRWARYGGLVLLSALSVVYPISLLPAWVVGNVPPIDTLPPGLLSSLYSATSQLLLRTGLESALQYVPGMLSVIYLLIWPLLGMIPAKYARRFVTELDEIESYHSPELFMQAFSGEVNRRIALWIQLAAGVVGFALVLFDRMAPFQGDTARQVALAAGLAVLLGLAVQPGGDRLPVWRRWLTVLGLVFFGAALVGWSTANQHIHLIFWGLAGLVLMPDLQARMPLGGRWALANTRRALYVGLLAYLAICAGQLLVDRTAYPLQVMYGMRATANFGTVLKMLFWLALGIGGAYAGMLAERTSGAKAYSPPRVLWLLLTVSGLVGLAAYIVLRIPLQFFWNTWTRGFLILAVLVCCGATAWLAVVRRKEMEQRLLTLAEKLSARSTRLSLPKVVDIWRQKAGGVIARMVGPAPLDGLEPVIGFTTTVLAVLFIPFVATILLSSIALASCLIGLLLPLALLIGVIWLVMRYTKK